MAGERDLEKLLRTMSPTLVEGEFVFCTLGDASYGLPDLVWRRSMRAVDTDDIGGLTLGDRRMLLVRLLMREKSMQSRRGALVVLILMLCTFSAAISTPPEESAPRPHHYIFFGLFCYMLN